MNGIAQNRGNPGRKSLDEDETEMAKTEGNGVFRKLEKSEGLVPRDGGYSSGEESRQVRIAEIFLGGKETQKWRHIPANGSLPRGRGRYFSQYRVFSSLDD